jgi:hypothetical protein
LKISQRVNALKSSRAVSRANAELKTEVSGIFSVCITRVDVVNDHTSLIYTGLSNMASTRQNNIYVSDMWAFTTSTPMVGIAGFLDFFIVWYSRK